MSRPRGRQRSRRPGWRLPQDGVIVDRTSRWGNPFTVAAAAAAGHRDPRRFCVDAFGAWLDGDPVYPDVLAAGRKRFDRRWMLTHLHQLNGKDLYCFCPEGLPCHRDQLLIRANPGGGGVG
jgi:hypothetical protein